MSSKVQYGGAPEAWVQQDPVDYDDATLVINTWETVEADLSGGKPAKLLYVSVEQTNNGAAVEDIELEITLNGVANTWTLGGIASGAIHWCTMTIEGVTSNQTGSIRMPRALVDGDYGPLASESIGLIRVRQTSVVDGVSASIEVNIVWDKKVVQ